MSTAGLPFTTEFKGPRGERPDRGAPRRMDYQKLFDKVPPHSPEAEMSLLGSMLLDYKVINEIIPLVSSGDCFYSQAHGSIFDALVHTYDKHRSGDLVQISEALKDKSLLEEVGGLPYLVQLAEGVPSSVNAVHYARIVREKWMLRRLIDASSDILYSAYNAGELYADAAQSVLDNAQKLIFDIADQTIGASGEELNHLLKQLMDMLIENEGRSLTGLDSGFYELNEITSGLQSGELIILAARPSMGKTAIALNLAEQVAFGGSPYNEKGPKTPVAIFSLEMSRQAIVQRLLCAHAGVDSQRMRRNMLGHDEFKRLIDSCNQLSEAPIYIDDTPGLSVMHLRAKARRLKQQHGIRCIFVDYLQLLTAPGSSREGRQQEVSAISRGIKALARELDLPIICLSQLNREAESREGHKPRMADLRESGSIEQDADTIMLLHREEYYHQSEPNWASENPEKVGVTELIIAKQRNGPTGTVELAWDSKTTRFKNLARGRSEFRADTGGGGNSSRDSAGPARPAPPAQSAGPANYQFPRPSGFAPGTKSGPVGDFRDGGGPDRDAPGSDDAGYDEPAPF
jgi:replicative DNA helicase